MPKKISFKPHSILCLPTKKNQTALSNVYMFYLSMNGLFRYSLEDDSVENIQLFGEQIFCIKDVLCILNRNILTVYFDLVTNILNYTVESRIIHIRQSEEYLLFICENSLECIRVERNKATQSRIRIRNIRDATIKDEFIYIVTAEEVFRANKILLNKENEYNCIGEGDLIKIDEFLTIKKTRLIYSKDVKRCYVFNDNIALLFKEELMVYKMDNGKLREKFKLKQSTEVWNIDQYGILSSKEGLVDMSKAPTMLLSDKIYCSSKNGYVGENRVYYVDEIKGEYSNRITMGNESIREIRIDKNEIVVPEYAKDVKELYINFKSKINEWNKIHEQISKNDSRNKIEQEVRELQESVEKEIAKLNKKKEVVEKRIGILMEKAGKIKMDTKRMRALMDELAGKLNRAMKKNISKYVGKLKMQKAAFLDMVE
ncbi:hypothetical protein ECANGB1_666 [Enterospora canceri]|uniref:Uncharacterized protein n=1 Tax=Enterospora canceri TaxID=1081671 RepID=A0A1Y1S7R0_9MICR|nr:hypothetical protein ECANGB1_666 [Enterospora canceri]